MFQLSSSQTHIPDQISHVLGYCMNWAMASIVVLMQTEVEKLLFCAHWLLWAWDPPHSDGFINALHSVDLSRLRSVMV